MSFISGLSSQGDQSASRADPERVGQPHDGGDDKERPKGTLLNLHYSRSIQRISRRAPVGGIRCPRGKNRPNAKIDFGIEIGDLIEISISSQFLFNYSSHLKTRQRASSRNCLLVATFRGPKMVFFGKIRTVYGSRSSLWKPLLPSSSWNERSFESHARRAEATTTTHSLEIQMRQRRERERIREGFGKFSHSTKLFLIDLGKERNVFQNTTPYHHPVGLGVLA